MRIALFVLGLCVAAAYGEECTVSSDCTTTQCAGDNQVVCEHPGEVPSINGGLCTCATNTPCVVREDCYQPAHPELNCPNEQRHCYDSTCICSRWPIGGK